MGQDISTSQKSVDPSLHAALPISARAWWFHTRMGEGSADLAPLGSWDENEEEPLRPVAELVAGLERTWQVIKDGLAGWTRADLEQVFPQYGEESPARSRKYIIRHV